MDRLLKLIRYSFFASVACVFLTFLVSAIGFQVNGVDHPLASALMVVATAGFGSDEPLPASCSLMLRFTVGGQLVSFSLLLLSVVAIPFVSLVKLVQWLERKG